MVQRSLSRIGQQIRNEVAGLRSGRRRRYPSRLQRLIVTYAKARLREGAARAGVSAELGVSGPTLVRLLGSEAGVTQFRPVRVVAEAQPKVAAEMRSVVVRAPGGIVVEGLDVSGVAALVRALSC